MALKILGPLCMSAAAWLHLPAQAESLKCNGQITSEGDTRLAVLHACGEPLLKDSFCAPLYVGTTLQPVPPQYVGSVVACQQVDEWLYDRGPGNLVAVVRFRAGVVQSIRYGRTPQ